jgi:hypothetical protein
MKTHYSLIYLCLLALLTPPLKAEAIQLSNQCSPNPLSAHSIATYTIVIKGSTQVSLPNFPSIPGLDIHFLGKGHSVQIINGQKQTELRLNYAIKAKHPGTYTLPALVLNVQNKPYEVPSTTLTVLPSSENDILKQSGITLSLKLDQTSVYVGQMLHCQVVLRVPAGIQGSILSDKPLCISESLQDLNTPAPPKEAHGQEAGQSFQEISWERTLKPSKGGTYSLGYELPLSLRIQSSKNRLSSLFDDHFLDPLSLFQSQDEEVLLSTPKHPVEVLELPVEGRPRVFSGYIGSLSAQVVETSLMDPEVGDPVTVKLILTGSGDLESLAPPSIEAHKAIKTYPPKETLLAEPPPSKLSSKVIEYILIPQEAGKLELAPLELNFFHPESGTYEHLSCPIPPLIVQSSSMPYQSPKLGENPPPPTNNPDSPKPADLEADSSQKQTALSGAVLQTHLGKLRPSILPSYLYSKSYWQAQLILLGFIGCGCILRYLHIRKQKQSTKLKAADTLKELLDAAKQALIQEDSPRFFASLEKVLKLSSRCTDSEESLQNLESFLSDHGASPDILSIARQLWELRESYTFGGGMSSQTKLKQAYSQLESLSHFLKTCLL